MGKKDVASALALIDGVNEEAGGQAGLSATGAAQPDDVLVVLHVAQRVIEGEELLLMELGLTGEGIGFQQQELWNGGAAQAQLPRSLALELAFLLDQVGEQRAVRKSLLGKGPMP